MEKAAVSSTCQQAVCPVSVQAACACSRLQCLCLYYSILQHLTARRTCAISPLLADSGVSDLSISISNIHLHLHLHIHHHGCHCTAPQLQWFIRCCASMSGSENQHQFISLLLVSDIGNKSTFTLRPHWRVATRVCMQLVSVTTIICTIVFPDSPCIAGLTSRC